MEFKNTTLSNGLTIIAEVNPSAKSMAAGFFARTGSRDETDEIAGVSHFLEHMIFKGTESRAALDVNREFDEMGAIYNAFTSQENTVYYAAVLPEFQTRSLNLLADILRPSLRQDDFDTEKKVICEEIAMYADQPFFRLYDTLTTQHFAGHPLANSVLGTTESITALRREQMVDYFNHRYSPTNVTLTAVGNVDFDQLVADAKAFCGHWTPFDAPRDRREPIPACTRNLICDPAVARQSLGMLTNAPSYQHPDRFAAEVLASIYGDSTGSRLYYALIETALADEAHCSYNPLDHAGMILTFASASPDNAAQVREVLLAEARKLLADGVSEAELAAAKNKIASAVTIKGEVPTGRLTAVGFDWEYRREHESLETSVNATLAVTADDVLRVATEIDLANPTSLTLGPLETL